MLRDSGNRALSRARGSSTAGRWLQAVILALVLLKTAQPGFALDLGNWVPGLQLTPFLSERIEYETNIFQMPSRSEEDVIVRTVAGFLAEYVAGPHSLSAGYRAEILNFLRLTSQDRVSHYLAGQLTLEFSRLRVSARDDFADTSNPPTTELTGRIENTTNLLVSQAEYRLTQRFSAGVNGSWGHVSVPTLPQLDRDEYLAGASVFWRAFPKADLQINYNHGEMFFGPTFSFRDVTRDLIMVAARGDVTSKLSSTFRIGYESRQQASGFRSYNGLVMGGGWLYKPTEHLTLTLGTDRSVQESVFGDQLFYVATTGTIAATQQFGRKLRAGLLFFVADNSYPGKETVNGQTKTRQDTLLGWGGGFSYEIQRWLRVGADYAHTARFSNFRTFNYQDDKLSFFVTLQI